MSAPTHNQSESQLKERLRKWLIGKGLDPIKVAGGPRQRSGISDLGIAIPPHGRMMWIELKAPGVSPTPTPQQMKFLESQAKYGCLCLVANEFEGIKAAVEAALVMEAGTPATPIVS